MGLDVYVGSLTRYYLADWETVAQRTAREGGPPVQVVRPESPDAIRDPEQVRLVVKSWRTVLSDALGTAIDQPLDWNEEAAAPYFTDKPTWDAYRSLLLWASYQEHPELPRPAARVEDWAHDPAYVLCAEPKTPTQYPNLLKGAEFWLPVALPFVFKAPDPAGNNLVFASAVGLVEDLELLNAQTWSVNDAELSAWRRAGAEASAPLEAGARFAFAVFLELARTAVADRLIMRLDY